jgi:hypothetical protein
MKEEALDRTLRRDGFGKGFGPAVKHTTEWMSCTGKPFAVKCSHFCLWVYDTHFLTSGVTLYSKEVTKLNVTSKILECGMYSSQ